MDSAVETPHLESNSLPPLLCPLPGYHGLHHVHSVDITITKQVGILVCVFIRVCVRDSIMAPHLCHKGNLAETPDFVARKKREKEGERTWPGGHFSSQLLITPPEMRAHTHTHSHNHTQTQTNAPTLWTRNQDTMAS